MQIKTHFKPFYINSSTFPFSNLIFKRSISYLLPNDSILGLSAPIHSLHPNILIAYHFLIPSPINKI